MEPAQVQVELVAVEETNHQSYEDSKAMGIEIDIHIVGSGAMTVSKSFRHGIILQ